MDSGSDESQLGRWSWIRIGNPDKCTRIVIAYNPVDPGRVDGAGGTVWEQHCRYFDKQGISEISPRTKFFQDLTDQIASWRSAKEEVILCIDANENVYSG